MTTKSHAPSRARRQAQAALARGRHARRHADHPGEIPGQLSIEDMLTELADDQEQEQGETR